MYLSPHIWTLPFTMNGFSCKMIIGDEFMTNEDLVKRIKTASATKAEDMERLYKQNIKAIYTIAKKYSSRVDLEELMQEGYIVLDEAVNSYPLDTDTKFIVYFWQLLKWHFSEYVFCSATTIFIPAHLKDTIYKYQKFKQMFFQEYGREPKREDYKKALNLSDKALEKIELAYASILTTSIDEPFSEDEELSYADTIPSDENIEETHAAEKESEHWHQALYHAMAKLDETEQIAIKRKYFNNEMLKEIAKDMDLTISQVNSLCNRAIRNLQRDNELVKAACFGGHYEDRFAYHYSVDRFKNTFMSSVEFVAIKNTDSYDNYYADKDVI